MALESRAATNPNTQMSPEVSEGEGHNSETMDLEFRLVDKILQNIKTGGYRTRNPSLIEQRFVVLACGDTRFLCSVRQTRLSNVFLYQKFVIEDLDFRKNNTKRAICIQIGHQDQSQNGMSFIETYMVGSRIDGEELTSTGPLPDEARAPFARDVLESLIDDAATLAQANHYRSKLSHVGDFVPCSNQYD